MSLYDEPEGIYLGNRGNDFKSFIDCILKKGKLKAKYRKILTDDSSMQIYASAFTSELVDANNNYQVLEQVGDLTGNKFIVNYMYERFPQLDCTEGVKVVARLRINYGAKQSFSEIARKLGFWPFISATNDMRQRKMKPLLEDVFEAFLGATERILDRKKRVGVGYAIVYDILATIFDEMDISLRYEDLYDAKTRLKELFDVHQDKLGSLVYKEDRMDHITISTVYRVKGRNYIKIGKGSAALKSDTQQNAAAAGLETLNKQGWVKPVPPIYKKFINYNEKKVDCDSKCESLVEDIKTSGTKNKIKKTKIDKLHVENKKIQDQILKKVSEMVIPETITYIVKVPKYNDDMEKLEFCFKEQYPSAQHLEIGKYYEKMDIKFYNNSIRVKYNDLNREELDKEYQFIKFSDRTCYHDDCDFSRNNDTHFCSQHQRVIDEKEINDILYKRLKLYNDSIKHRLDTIIEKDLTPPKKIRGNVCVPNDTCENDTYDWILKLK